MSFLFGAPKAATPPPPQPAPPPPTPTTDPAVVAAQQAQARNAAEAAGRASTILTSGQGDTSAAPIGRKTLLGQ